MRAIFLLVFCILAIATTGYANSSLDCGDATKIAIEIKNAVTTQNVRQLLRHVEEGMWFGDSSFSKKQIAVLLNNKHSWLYKLFFDDKKSMRQYLISNNTVLKVMYNKEDALVYYSSEGLDLALTPGIVLMCVNGKWRITDVDIFYAD